MAGIVSFYTFPQYVSRYGPTLSLGPHPQNPHFVTFLWLIIQNFYDSPEAASEFFYNTFLPFLENFRRPSDEQFSTERR